MKDLSHKTQQVEQEETVSAQTISKIEETKEIVLRRMERDRNGFGGIFVLQKTDQYHDEDYSEANGAHLRLPLALAGPLPDANNAKEFAERAIGLLYRLLQSAFESGAERIIGLTTKIQDESPKAQRDVRRAAESAIKTLNSHANELFFEATSEFIAWTFTWKPSSDTETEPLAHQKESDESPIPDTLNAEQHQLRQQVEQLQYTVQATCNTMIQLWRVMGRGNKEGDLRSQQSSTPDLKNASATTSEAIYQAKNQYMDTGVIDIVVTHGGEVTKEVAYSAPSLNNPDEVKMSPFLEAMTSSVVFQAKDKLYEQEAERRREQERARQVRYQKRYREENPDEAKVKEREKKRRYRAKKQQEAESSTD